MSECKTVLEYAKELQSIAAAGLCYSKDVFDRERFERLQEIAAELVSAESGADEAALKAAFAAQTGYQTPKLETRAAIFEDGRVLLVQELDGMWSMPGGWCDHDQTVLENICKECWEEAGLTVQPGRVVCLHEQNIRNKPANFYHICKVFVLCDVISGSFQPNSETLGSGWFSLDDLPRLANGKVTAEQIRLCYEAKQAEHWETMCD